MHGYVFTMQYPCGWVSPFGHRRIKACCQLPDAFRRLPRPSSPLTAKASTVCAYSLDHITPSCLEGYAYQRMVRLITISIRQLSLPALASTTRCRQFVSNARYIPIFKEHAPASTPGHLKVCVRRIIQSGGSGRTRTTGLALIRGAL